MTRVWRNPVAEDAQRLDPAAVADAGARNHHIANTAYPIAHEQTWGPYRVPRAAHPELVARAWDGIDDLCLYVHIPFCETRCSFCEYTVVKSAEATDEHVSQYVDALLAELDLQARVSGTAGRTLHGLDLGGGTPAFIAARHIDRILAAVRARYRFAPGSDVSIETTPSIAAAEPDKLRAYRKAGIDRISMGIQVVQPDLLRVLNREKNGIASHARAVENIRAAGFSRFNVDLMYGFFGQSLASWEATVAHAIALAPEYITLYRMRYKLTRISHHAPHVTLEEVQPLAARAKELLEAAGYHANPGKTTFSRIPGDVGTSSYLAQRVTQGMPYLGLGLGAQSFTHTTISYNDGAVGKNLAPYLRSVSAGRLPIQDLYDLPRAHMMAKTCAVSFYFGEIDRAAFEAKFGIALEDEFAPEIALLEQRGWMTRNARALSLTKQGAPFTCSVIPLFYAGSAQRYLLARDPAAATDLHRHRTHALRTA